MHTINGTKFQEGNPANVFPVNQGAVEEWKVVNATFGPQISHPFHIHINPFQIVEVFNPNATVSDPVNGTMPKYVFDGSPLAQSGAAMRGQSAGPEHLGGLPQRYLERAAHLVGRVPDSVRHDGDRAARTSRFPDYFRMRSRFVDYGGQYVFHCHILAHEDRGMMAIVQVAPKGTPVRRDCSTSITRKTKSDESRHGDQDRGNQMGSQWSIRISMARRHGRILAVGAGRAGRVIRCSPSRTIW